MVDTCTVTWTARDFTFAVQPGSRFVFIPDPSAALTGGAYSVYIPTRVEVTCDAAGEGSIALVPGYYELSVMSSDRTITARVAVPNTAAANLGAQIEGTLTLLPMTEFQEGVVKTSADASAAAGARAAAEAARDAAVVAGAVVAAYPSSVAGVSATTSGQKFWAPSGDYLQLYTNTAGSAVAMAGVITPLKSYFDSRFSDTAESWALRSEDGFLAARLDSAGYLQSMGGLKAGSAVIEQPTDTLRLGSLYCKASAVSGLQFLTDDGFVLLSTANFLNLISMD